MRLFLVHRVLFCVHSPLIVNPIGAERMNADRHSEKLELGMKEIEKIFSCTRCGNCCHGETTVSLDAEDQERMCRELGLPREQVASRYWKITGNVVQMKVVEGHCIFYKDGCTVHGGRPWRCAEWPLHPSILNDESNFSAIADSCPGIQQDLGYDEFCIVLRRILEKQIRARC